MTNLTKLRTLPPVGTRCMYRNSALKLEGWGVLVDPRDPEDALEVPILLPWEGELQGPENAGQKGLNALAPGCGVLPGVGYRVLPSCLLYVEAEPEPNLAERWFSKYI